MICQNCNNTTFYTLANDYIKCKTCAKKYSLKKLQKDRNKNNSVQISKEIAKIKDNYNRTFYKIKNQQQETILKNINLKFMKKLLA